MLEVVRSVQAALLDATDGVNARLPLIPRATGHAAPPTIAQILTSDDDLKLAFGDKSETFPALIILDEDDGKWDAEVATRARDGDVRVTILYVVRDPRAALTYRHSSYTRRAVNQSLRRWLDNTSAPQRTENNVFVISGKDLADRPATTLIRGIPHAGAVSWVFRVRDLAP